MKSQVYQLDMSTGVSHPIHLSQAELEAMEKDSSERFTPDFTSKAILEMRRHTTPRNFSKPCKSS